ncbi:MAG: hypothetical protein BJBARM4_0007 [Candidatus Parvarchaeum acidiphilum ARMAN-4]|uniref:Uncharacterized protein n=1 Tax=Candidatus Parvarchaeum acidiphilum ARMAN-4 TaxID=662760 RepID=D2EE75_PARA4|nr:MAG: hypothetical protein BJBARM4_0007 [Candidatus Parvarchaeum acidiphilum ARMAN-4]
MVESTKTKGVSIKYIKAPVYMMTIDLGDTKKTLNENKKILDFITKKSKNLGIEFKYTEIRQ